MPKLMTISAPNNHNEMSSCREGLSRHVNSFIRENPVLHTDMTIRDQFAQRVDVLQRGLDELARYTPDSMSTASLQVFDDWAGRDHLRVSITWNDSRNAAFHWWWSTLLQRIVATTTKLNDMIDMDHILRLSAFGSANHWSSSTIARSTMRVWEAMQANIFTTDHFNLHRRNADGPLEAYRAYMRSQQ